MKVRILKFGILVLSLFVFTQVANAQSERLTPEERFAKIDANSDGFIDLEEFKAGLADRKKKNGREIDPEKIFTRKDVNSDNLLSLEEFKARPKSKRKM